MTERDWDRFYKFGPKARLMVDAVEVRSRWGVPAELSTMHAALLEMTPDERARIDRIDCDSNASAVYTVRLMWNAPDRAGFPPGAISMVEYDRRWRHVAEAVGRGFAAALRKVGRGHNGIFVEREAAESLANFDADWEDHEIAAG